MAAQFVTVARDVGGGLGFDHGADFGFFFDRKDAADYYNRFVELWKNADTELQPGVKEVRGRLARLAQEPGT